MVTSANYYVVLSTLSRTAVFREVCSKQKDGIFGNWKGKYTFPFQKYGKHALALKHEYTYFSCFTFISYFLL